MSNPRRSRSSYNGDKLTAEFTSGQLVIGIVCMLFLCVACFMAGILVGKVDPALQDTAAAGQPAPTGAGVQQSPRTDLPGLRPVGDPGMPPLPPPPRPENAPIPVAKPAAAPSAPAAPPATATAPPAPAGGGTVRQRMDVPAGTTPPATAVAAAAPAPATPIAALPPVEPAPPKPVPLTAADPPDTPVAPAAPAEPAAQPAPAAGGARYCIQLASLRGADRAAKAESFMKRMKDQHGLNCRVLPSDDGDILRLVVPDFPDKPAAESALADIRKKPGLTDAFVRTQ